MYTTFRRQTNCHRKREEKGSLNACLLTLLICRYSSSANLFAYSHWSLYNNSAVTVVRYNKPSLFQASCYEVRPECLKNKPFQPPYFPLLERGATRFSILSSVIDTAIENTQNVFESLSLLAEKLPFFYFHKGSLSQSPGKPRAFKSTEGYFFNNSDNLTVK